MQCEKENLLDEDGLPKATQTGAMVFACKVNGENWMPQKKRDIDGGFYEDKLHIKGSVISSNWFERFEIEIKKPENRMKFRLNNEVDEGVALFISDKTCFSAIYGDGVGYSQSTDGEIVFTRIDTEKKILSGTFWFDIPADKCGVLKVTHGRFDVRYY